MALTKEQTEKKNKLNQYTLSGRAIDRKLAEIEDLNNKKYNISAVLSDMPKSPNSDNKLERCIVELDQLMIELNKELEGLKKQRDHIEKCIGKVKNDRYRELLEYRYINDYTFEEIAYYMKNSWRHVHRLHELALDSVKI